MPVFSYYDMDTPKPRTVDEYIAAAPSQAREYLEHLRHAILQAAPEAEESVYYELPVYKQNGILVYLGGFTKHVSLYPGPDAIEVFKEELVSYKTIGGTIRFPLNKPIPVILIKKIVRFRVKQNLTT